ncbi:MAG: DUF1730 domain-containing protein [Planctomycetia bacterium]|nr:DUF1730 domain-containing protein [Planctomycetia bacterium]
MSSQETLPNVPRSVAGNATTWNGSFSCACLHPCASSNLSFNPTFFTLRSHALSLGLDAFSLAPVADAAHFPIFCERVAQGRCSNISYLVSDVEARRNPRSVLPQAQTLIIVALSEKKVVACSQERRKLLANAPELHANSQNDSYVGKIIPYASCLDYHDVLRGKLRALMQFYQKRFPDGVARIAVDTAPLLEKSWAVVSGLGQCGLHSLAIHPTLGSRFFLGELLVSTPFETLSGYSTLEEYRQAYASLQHAEGIAFKPGQEPENFCKKCRRCLHACPTNAIPGDRTLNATRCLNFWTIENRDPLPEDISEALQGRLFGCDLCQRVCPYNASLTTEEPMEIPLCGVENLEEASFRRLFKKTPIFRARLEGLQRVAAQLRRRQGGNLGKKE